jgi:putative phage-type endonuclease
MESESESDSDAESDTTTTTTITTVDVLSDYPDDIEEYILEEIDELVNANPLVFSKPNVEKQIAEEVATTLFTEWLHIKYCQEEDQQEIKDIVAKTVDVYFETQVPRRQGGCAAQLTPLRRASIANKLHIKQLPPQKTPEWYQSRFNMITASNFWKAIGTESQQNSLIVEKCQPFEQFKEDCARHGNLSSNNPMSWGTKYEAITARIYEIRNNTKLGEYGCIVHPEWPFVGASPDGINVDPDSATYGRMVEIKNIVNREITGIPLEHYWIQMQVQMEVCDLDECDFVETRIKEFADNTAYAESANEWKGAVLTFTQRVSPFTRPVSLLPDFREYFVATKDAPVEDWIVAMKTKHAESYVLSATDYWELDQYSCVLVLRNKQWFETAVKKVESVWRTIEKERKTGCEHRAAKKRPPAKMLVVKHTD